MYHVGRHLPHPHILFPWAFQHRKVALPVASLPLQPCSPCWPGAGGEVGPALPSSHPSHQEGPFLRDLVTSLSCFLGIALSVGTSWGRRTSRELCICLRPLPGLAGEGLGVGGHLSLHQCPRLPPQISMLWSSQQVLSGGNTEC